MCQSLIHFQAKMVHFPLKNEALRSESVKNKHCQYNVKKTSLLFYVISNYSFFDHTRFNKIKYYISELIA